MSKPRERVPDAETFSRQLFWTRAEMQARRDFERLIDWRLAALKEEILQTYRDYQGPPAFWPKEAEER
jgi:hypothetical protein